MTAPLFDLSSLRARLADLAKRKVYVGTSSWKYQGWLGQIYTPSRYEYRGKVAATRFERDCLAEYAETFPTVCVDAAYYAFPTEKSLLELRAKVTSDFRFAFKVTDETTVRRYPSLPRFGERAGVLNENFLNAPVFIEKFLGPLRSIRDNVGPIIFEFSKFYPADYAHGADFVAELDRFLSQLPKDWTYAVELRNRQWLVPEYLDMLRKHEVAHVFNSWTHMPPVPEQLETVGERHADRVTVARFLLKPGRDYETAVEMFQPYEIARDVSEDVRRIGARLMREGALKPRRDGTFLYVNNRLEGNAPVTIQGMLAILEFIEDPAGPPAAS